MIPDRLRAAALLPLWQAVHDRLSSGQAVSRVRIGPLDTAQRSALADLLGMARYPAERATVSLATLDTVLLDTIGLDARAVVAEIVGPLDDRAGRRARATEQRTRLWEWLATHEVVVAQPALREWVEQVRRAGVVDGSVERTGQSLESALRVLRALPAEGMPLPAFADSVLGEPHALDDGTRVSGLVLRALAAIYGADVPASAEQRRALWERAGVADDELSTTVLAAGLSPDGADTVASVLRKCASAAHASALTLAQLRTTDELSVPHPDVWVVENPSVLAMALRRFGTACPPMVCTSGWPNSAGIVLLRLLGEAGSRVHYHGDLDGEGVRIAAYVIDKTTARTWRMSTADYLAALPEHHPGPHPGRVTEAPWDEALAPTMCERNVAVTQERIAATLLDDLATHQHTCAS